MVFRVASEHQETLVNELAELNIKRDMLVRTVLANLALSEEDQKMKKAWLERAVSHDTFKQLLEERMTAKMHEHPLLKEIKAVISEYFLKRDGKSDDLKVNEKLREVLRTAAFQKMTEYILLYRNSPSGKPMRTIHLLQ